MRYTPPRLTAPQLQGPRRLNPFVFHNKSSESLQQKKPSVANCLSHYLVLPQGPFLFLPLETQLGGGLNAACSDWECRLLALQTPLISDRHERVCSTKPFVMPWDKTSCPARGGKLDSIPLIRCCHSDRSQARFVKSETSPLPPKQQPARAPLA